MEVFKLNLYIYTFFTFFSINWAGRSAADIAYTNLMTMFCYISHVIVLVFCYLKIKLKSDGVIKSLRSKQSFSVDDAVKVNKFRSEEKVTFVSNKSLSLM